LRVWAWGVRDRDALRQAVAAGIGGCTLDFPDWAGGAGAPDGEGTAPATAATPLPG
jgi:hypothetical protein